MKIRQLGTTTLCCVYCISLLSAQPTDTVRYLETISVRALAWSKYAVGSRVESIDSAFVAQYRTASLTDAMQMRTGLYLKNYGSGMLATPSFRGTGAGHTAVLWNGLNVSLPTLGQSDFSILPVFAVSKIAVQYGNGGALYGSGSIGGSILLHSEDDFHKNTSAEIFSGLGSFGKKSLSGLLRLSKEKISFSGGFQTQNAENNFHFRNTAVYGLPVEHQTNARFQQTGFYQNLAFKTGKSGILAVRTWYNDSFRQLQPAMGSDPKNARQADKNLRLMASFQQKNRSGGVFSLKTAFFSDKLNYYDDNTDSESSVNTWQMQGNYEVLLRSFLSVKAGGEVQYFSAQVDGYRRNVSENRASLFFLSRLQFLKVMEASLNIRQSFVQSFNPPLTPGFGLNGRFLNKNRLKGIFKTNLNFGYRVPTLNDRYWIPGGNPSIRPELSKSAEVGWLQTLDFQKGRAEAEVTFFRSEVKDWIEWMPNAKGVWSPFNLSQVQVQGIEFSAKYLFSTTYQFSNEFGLHYNYQSSLNKVTFNGSLSNRQRAYTPRHLVNFYHQLAYKTWLISYNLAFTDFRNTLDYRKLQAYLLCNMLISKSFTFYKQEVQLLFKLNNLLNTHYQTYEARAMPGRNAELNLRFSLTKRKKAKPYYSIDYLF